MPKKTDKLSTANNEKTILNPKAKTQFQMAPCAQIQAMGMQSSPGGRYIFIHDG